MYCVSTINRVVMLLCCCCLCCCCFTSGCGATAGGTNTWSRLSCLQTQQVADIEPRTLALDAFEKPSLSRVKMYNNKSWWTVEVFRNFNFSRNLFLLNLHKLCNYAKFRCNPNSLKILSHPVTCLMGTEYVSTSQMYSPASFSSTSCRVRL